MRPNVANKSTKECFVNISLTSMSAHVCIDVKEFKKKVTKAKGKNRASLPFLNDTSTDNIVTPTINGKQKSCSQIPHSSISNDVLNRLINRGKN